jgi:hypothetical protein
LAQEPHKLPLALWIGIAVVLIGAGIAAVMMGGKDDAGENTVAQQTPTPTAAVEADIALQNVGLKDLTGVDYTVNATREFKTNGLKGFYIFGDKLSGGRVNPNFEFSSLKKGTEVVAAIDGVIGFINEQADTNDYEVFLQPKDGSAWTIGYDHLVDLKVKKGDVVKAGAVLGTPAVQNNGLYRFEMQINKDVAGVTTHYCPSVLLSAGVKDGILADLGAMQTKWETTSKLELYNLESQSPVGCTKATMSVAEAEGK